MGDLGEGAVLTRAAAAVRAGASGSLPVRAAVEIALTSSLVDRLVPDYVEWLTEDTARVEVERFLAEERTLSGSEVVLARLAVHLMRGPEGDGVTVDLRDLWTLDDRNRRAVFKALRDTLLVHNAFHHDAAAVPTIPSH